MKSINKKQWRTITLLLLYVAAVTVSIFYAVSYFMSNSTERGLLAFERFSEQITYRVSDHLSKYTEQMILLKSELIDRQVTDLDEIQHTFQRYMDNSALKGIGFVLEDGTARSYTGEIEVFDQPIDVLDVHNYPYTVTLSQNAVNGEEQLLFRILWDGQGDSSAVAIYGYLPMSTISDLLKDTTYGNAGAFVSIVDHEGNHLWNSSDTLENKEGHNVIEDLEVYNLNDGATAQQVATRLNLQLSGLVTYTAHGGDERVMFYEPIGYNYWTLLTVTPRASVLNTENEIKMILVLTAGILAIVVVALWFLYKNRRMKLALEVAQQESVFKGQFLSNVSHEIRTPLNGISGTLRLLKSGHAGAAQKEEYLLRMEDSVQQLTEIVNDVLDMAKIENGSMYLRPERFDLRKLSEKTLHLFDATVQEKGIALEMDISGLRNRFYVGDARKIQQILTNLLSNAVKFTSQGSVSLSLSEESGEVCILVSDTGCGMTKEFQKILFQPFTQEDTTYGRTQTGTGLGMAIISELVQLLQGAVSVESEPGKGTTFTVSLPLQADSNQAEREETPAPPQVSLNGIHILMAEDNEINAMIAEELLTQAGAEVKTVENGQLAVEYFLDPASEPVDIILMDIRMPVMDGLEATRRIRASDHPRAQSIPILALTANGLEEDNKEILEAGMNERLSKPLSVELLYESIQTFTKGNQA